MTSIPVDPVKVAASIASGDSRVIWDTTRVSAVEESSTSAIVRATVITTVVISTTREELNTFGDNAGEIMRRVLASGVSVTDPYVIQAQADELEARAKLDAAVLRQAVTKAKNEEIRKTREVLALRQNAEDSLNLLTKMIHVIVQAWYDNIDDSAKRFNLLELS